MKQENNQFKINPACEQIIPSYGSLTSPATGGEKDRQLAAYLIRFLITAAILMSVLLAQATTGFTGEPRRKVAVVLSGGGAKGVAHVGVLKALEEYEIPIDYIAGTSMGAIVGGLYAAGFSPDEIEAILMSKEFEDASRGIIDEKYHYYYLQQDPDPTWFSLSLDWERRLEFQNILKDNLPTNIVSPFLMDFMLMELLGPANAAAANDFDKLFVPFRCVASDIKNKKQVVMRRGNFPDAVRASMTFPLYFKPITIDGVMLMDGGMFNNFPADIALNDFNPDMIIGSVVAANPSPPDPHNLVSQLENMLMHQTSYQVYSRYGVVIEPEVPDLAVTDFSQNQMVIKAGYDATMKKMSDIVSQVDYRQSTEALSQRRQAFRESIPEVVVKDIYVSGLKNDHVDFVNTFLNPDNEILSLDNIKANYLRLLSFTRFQHVYPRMRYNKETQNYTLCLEMEKNREIMQAIGGNISSHSANQIFAKSHFQKLSSTPRSVSTNLYFGNFYKSASVTGRLDLTGKSAGFALGSLTYSHWKYATQSVFIFEEAPSSYITQGELTADLRIGKPAGYRAKLELGTSIVHIKDRYYHSQFFSRLDTADITRFSPWVTYLSYEYNTLNRKQMASQGKFFNATLRYVEGNERNSPGSTAVYDLKTVASHSWWEFQMKYEQLFSIDSKLNPGIVSELFLSNRPLFSNYASSMIMARQFNPFPLARTRYLPQYRANQYLAAGVKTLYCFSRKVHLQAEAYLFQPLKKIESAGNTLVKYKEFPTEMSLMGNMAFIYHTPPGPLSFSLSYFQNESQPWVFMINFGYILFNRQTFL